MAQSGGDTAQSGGDMADGSRGPRAAGREAPGAPRRGFAGGRGSAAAAGRGRAGSWPQVTSISPEPLHAGTEGGGWEPPGITNAAPKTVPFSAAQPSAAGPWAERGHPCAVAVAVVVVRLPTSSGVERQLRARG